MTGQVSGDRADSAGKRPEEVGQELVLVVDVREVALAREDVECRHHVVLAVSAEPAGVFVGFSCQRSRYIWVVLTEHV